MGATAIQAQPLGNGNLNPLNYLFKPGLAGGQTANGGTGVAQSLRLRGTSDASLGSVISESPIVIEDTSAQSAIPYALQYAPPQTFAAGFIGGGINISPTITFNNALFIWEGVRGLPIITSGVAPSFAAFTLFQSLPVLRTLTTNAPLNALVINAGPVQEQAGVAVAATAGTSFGMNWAPQARASAVFSTINITTLTAVQCTPTYSGVASSVVNFGTINGMSCNQPALALFQTSPGTITLTAYNGVLFPDFTFGPATQTVSVINSALNAGTNKRFLRHTGTARSDLGGNLTFPADLIGVTFGASDDVGIGWGAAGFFFMQFNALVDQLRISNPSADRFLFNDGTGAAEFNFNCSRFSLGAQIGAVGNQVGVFVTPARTMTINGGWSDFLLTQGGNITIATGITASQLAGWTINAPAITLAGTGAVTDAMAMLVGGNVNEGTNRYGLQVLSNPSGGTLNYCARFQGAAGVRIDGILEHGNANLGFYGTAPIAQQLGVAVTAAGIHAALVALGLIT